MLPSLDRPSQSPLAGGMVVVARGCTMQQETASEWVELGKGLKKGPYKNGGRNEVSSVRERTRKKCSIAVS